MRFGGQGPSLAVHTPAKLNLSLEVLGRRPDGYHELETVMVSIGLYDTLLFTEDTSYQTRLQCLWTDLWSTGRSAVSLGGADNLIVRAAELLRAATGCTRGVTIDLWKRIPVQAGLGGGSSDAAATLVGLNRLWNLKLGTGQLHELAARLGSDVNFFLESPLAAICRGRGEQIEALAADRRLHFVVACPGSGLSTADVFRHWARGKTDATRGGRLEAGHGVRWPEFIRHRLRNDLEESARALNRDVGRTLDALRAAGATAVLMSGSGSACFAVCRSALHARAIAGRLRQQHIARVFSVDMRA